VIYWKKEENFVSEVFEVQERKRPMPVGIEDFGELIQREYYFVDKTRFIRELLDAQGKIIYNKEELKKGTLPTKVSDIFEPEDAIEARYTISDRMWEGHQKRKERNRKNGKGFGYSLFSAGSTYTSTISARYWKDGSEILIDQSDKGLNPRILTPVEAGRLQGYRIIGKGWQHPECANNQNYNDNNPEFKIVASNKEAYHQFGNSVAIPVIKALAKEIVKQLLSQLKE
jgi:DNA (cytosine-5)-methyltransferase 1